VAKNKNSIQSIIDKNRGTNPGSRKIQPQYVPGKTTFLDSQQRATINQYKTKAHNNHVYNAVVIDVERGNVPNILSFGNLGSNKSNMFVVRAAIPELHSMYPDPFKFNFHPSIIRMYPTFAGPLDEIPLIGSTVGVAFIDENNKFQEYGNGKIISFIQNPIDGSPQANAARAQNNAINTASGRMLLGQAACKFLELAGTAPQDEKPDLPNQDNTVGQNSPQTINSSFQNRTSTVERTTQNDGASPGTNNPQQITEEDQDSISSTTNLPDCKKVSSLEEYVAAFASAVPSGSQDPNAEYPAWPLVYGAYNVNTRSAISPANLTSPINPYRTITVRKNGKLQKLSRPHMGQDISCPQGTPTLSVLPGKVVAAVPNGGIPTNKNLSYIIIEHSGYGGKGSRSIHSCYFHMSQVLVREGDMVDRGTCIGLSGGAKDSLGAGGTTGPHLHLEIRKRRRAKSMAHIMDPRAFLATKWKKGDT